MLLLNRVGGNMAHFAELNDSNVVLRVIVISNEDVDANGGDYHADAEAFVKSKFGGHLWKQCSYNNSARKRMACKGFTYDSSKDKFIAPKPHASWELDENDDWKPAGDIGTPDGDYGLLADSTQVKVEDKRWDEDNQKWLGTSVSGGTGKHAVWTEFEWNPSTSTWDRV